MLQITTAPSNIGAKNALAPRQTLKSKAGNPKPFVRLWHHKPKIPRAAMSRGYFLSVPGKLRCVGAAPERRALWELQPAASKAGSALAPQHKLKSKTGRRRERKGRNRRLRVFVLIMKSLFNIIALILVSKSTSAAPALPTVPPAGEKNQKFANELLNHSLDAINGAKNYRGAMIMERSVQTSEGYFFAKDSLRVRTQWRLNSNGDKSGEWAFLLFKGERTQKNGSRIARVVDDGKRQFASYGEVKSWSREERDPEPLFRLILRSCFRNISPAVKGSAIVPAVEARLEGGRAVYIVSEAGKGIGSRFNVVIDAQDHFLRSFVLTRGNTQIELRLFDQEFDPKLDEKLFLWHAPRGFRQVKAGTAKLDFGKSLEVSQ